MAELAFFLFAVLLPNLIAGSGEGNLHLLEDEVATAMRSCITPSKDSNSRQKRLAQYSTDDSQYPVHPRIDGSNQQEINQYSHERRNTSDMKDQIHVLNATDYDYESYSNVGVASGGEKLVNSVARPAANAADITNRTRRSDPLVAKPDSDQCFSQCIFANLQIVDVRGIPREAELWNRVQSSVTSQQSRAALRDQLHACFQELQSEAEDDGCSYSNKLERCLMLRFSDRKTSLDTVKSTA